MSSPLIGDESQRSGASADPVQKPLQLPLAQVLPETVYILRGTKAGLPAELFPGQILWL